MEAAHGTGDVEASPSPFAFHDAVLRPAATRSSRPCSDSVPRCSMRCGGNLGDFKELQRHAVHHHKLVLAAIASGDPQSARLAMDAHISQTYEDYERHLAG